MLKKHKLIILTKDKSLDTWIYKLLSYIKMLSFETNSGKYNQLREYFLPKVEIKSNLILYDKDISVKFIYFQEGEHKEINLDLDSEDIIRNKYGYSAIALEVKSLSTLIPKELSYIYDKLQAEYEYEVFVEVEEFLCI